MAPVRLSHRMLDRNGLNEGLVFRDGAKVFGIKILWCILNIKLTYFQILFAVFKVDFLGIQSLMFKVN